MSYYGSGDASDPWEQSAGYPAYEESTFDEPEQPPPPPPTPPRGSTALVVVLVSVLVIVLCGGGVAALYLIGAKDRQPAPAPVAATPAATSHPSSAAPSPTYDPSAIIKGNCVANEGTDDAPVLKVVACAPNTFKVLAKFDGTLDTNKCKQVAGSTHHYFYDTTPDTLDFVLCLQKQ